MSWEYKVKVVYYKRSFYHALMSMPVLNSATIPFLREIKEQNTRKYFATVKPLYQDILSQMNNFCQQLIDDLDIKDSGWKRLLAKDCLFRIYRDARRLKEGDLLYKENFWFRIGQNGRKWTDAGFYLHLQPGTCLLGWGIYRPTSEQLFALRQKLSDHGDEYLKLIQKKEFVWQFGEVEGSITKVMPRGFDSTDPYADLIKRKQHLIYQQYTDEDITKDNFYDRVFYACKTTKPWFDRMNEKEEN